MIHSKRLTPIITLIMVMVLNCCNQATTDVVVNVTLTETANLTTTPAPHLELTPTNDVQVRSPVIEQCPNVTSYERVSEINANGVIVLLGNRDLGDIRNAFLLNLMDQQQINISHEGEILSYYGIAVSPDRKTLAYRTVNSIDESIKLVLSDNMGETQESILLESNIPYPLYGKFRNWLNNQQLLLDGQVFNPYTEETQSFRIEDFPSILPDDFGVNSLQFDPGISRVIYPNTDAKIVLMELSTKQVLAQVPARSRGIPKVAWSPTGDLVAIVGAGQALEETTDEIFIVDRDGKNIKQSTYLSSNYGPGYVLSNISWSPDGRSIAFWQNDQTLEKKGLRLFVLDIESERLTSYCTWGGTTNATLFGPIWSPDSQQLLIGDFSLNDSVRAVIIDVKKNIAIPIEENVIPVGWMIGP